MRSVSDLITQPSAHILENLDLHDVDYSFIDNAIEDNPACFLYAPAHIKTPERALRAVELCNDLWFSMEPQDITLEIGRLVAPKQPSFIQFAPDHAIDNDLLIKAISAHPHLIYNIQPHQQTLELAQIAASHLGLAAIIQALHRRPDLLTDRVLAYGCVSASPNNHLNHIDEKLIMRGIRYAFDQGILAQRLNCELIPDLLTIATLPLKSITHFEALYLLERLEPEQVAPFIKDVNSTELFRELYGSEAALNLSHTGKFARQWLEEDLGL